MRRHPDVAVRVVGENSVQLADAVRAGRLEAGLVALPIDDEGLEVGAAVARLEVVHAGAGAHRPAGPTTIEALAAAVLVLPEARWGDEDPTRRQLAARAQRAGVAIGPRIEVQHANASLELAARGVGRHARHPRAARRARLRRPARLGAARPAAVRDVRLHPAPQHAPLTGHARADDPRGAAPRGVVLGGLRGIAPGELRARRSASRACRARPSRGTGFSEPAPASSSRRSCGSTRASSDPAPWL